MEQSKPQIKVEDIVRRIREKLGRGPDIERDRIMPPASSTLVPIEWNRIGGDLAGADQASRVWTTKTRMDHYPGPVKWIASLVAKVILYLNQVVTKPQQEFNVAAVQTMASLRDGLTALDQNLAEINVGIAALAQNIQVIHESLGRDIQMTRDSLSKNIQGAQESVKILASNLEGAVSRQAQMEQLRAELASRIHALEQLPGRIATAEQILASHSILPSRVTSLEDETRLISDHANALEQLNRAVGEARQRIADQEQRTAAMLEEARKRLPKAFDDKQLQKFSDELESMEDALYIAFENKFRGSQEEIKERVRVYLPTIRNSGAGTEARPILDVGCGRGEWLELLKDNKLQAYGIDSNKAMVKHCETKGLRVTKGDVLAYLANVHAESLGAVTGFHIIEHLPFNAWLKLLDEALRTLQKGGVAIFETPNPDNVLVGSNSFYLDPTHRNPLPSEMVKFMAEQRGFGRVEILKLNAIAEANAIKESTDVASRFNRHFYGPMDYAVLAWKL